MSEFSNELRLIWCVLLNAMAFSAAFRFARTSGAPGRGQRCFDALLLWLLLQYLSVTIPGLLHILYPATITLTAILLSAVLWFSAKPAADDSPVPSIPAKRNYRIALGYFAKPAANDSSVPSIPPNWNHRIALAATVFAAGFIAAFAVQFAYFPIIQTDPVVYHLPTAVTWLQSHSLKLYDVWYWMPANTYSPLAGTAFTVWWIAPLNNDVFARGVQLPAIVFIFIAMYQLCQETKGSGTFCAKHPSGRSGKRFLTPLSPATSALLAAATALCRPFLSQTLIPKDDVYVSAFFLATIAAMAERPMRDRLGPWRVGACLALLLATKYTVFLSVPVLFLAIDAPFRAGWRWRQWAIASACVLLLAGPWYLRNLLLTGNPIYPVDINLFGHRILTGLFTAEPTAKLRSLHGVWAMLTDIFFGMPAPMLIVLLLIWVAALAAAGATGRGTPRPVPRSDAVRHRSASTPTCGTQTDPLPGIGMVRAPLERLVLLGIPLGLILFVLKSPHAEVRYMFPLFLLLLAAAAIAIRSWLSAELPRNIAAAALLALSVSTTFQADNIEFAIWFAVTGVLIAAAALGLHFLLSRARHPRHIIGAGAGLAALVFVGVVYVHWTAYIEGYQGDFELAWTRLFPDSAPAWMFVRSEIPKGAVIAQANTQTVYPLYAFNFENRVVYAPVRPGVHHLHDLPHLPPHVPADDVLHVISRIANSDADRKVWLANLRAAGARYLYVSKIEASQNPPELAFADADPATFQRIFDNAAIRIYRIAPP